MDLDPVRRLCCIASMNAQSALVWIVCAVILAVGLALHGGRYEFAAQGMMLQRFDRWTGHAWFRHASTGQWVKVGDE
jgi:hypothetical protein